MDCERASSVERKDERKDGARSSSESCLETCLETCLEPSGTGSRAWRSKHRLARSVIVSDIVSALRRAAEAAAVEVADGSTVSGGNFASSSRSTRP